MNVYCDTFVMILKVFAKVATYLFVMLYFPEPERVKYNYYNCSDLHMFLYLNEFNLHM